MIRYQIRSIALLNIVNDVKAGRLIPDAYFQRNLVWRDVHKRDFIETILKGLPFPQMFFSRGKIDVIQMTATACIVDGQQRTAAIIDFIDNKFQVDGRNFRDLNGTEKSDFLKYEIGVVELDLENDDPQLKEVFARVNRTSNSLTTIEKLTSEYAPTEYMFTARLLANDLEFPGATDEEADWRIDPNIPEDLFEWAITKNIHFQFATRFELLQVFGEREISRRVHVMYVLNIMSTLLAGFFNRNEKTMELLNDFGQNFPERDRIVELIEKVGGVLDQLSLPPKGFWAAKANFFSLCVALAKSVEAGTVIDFPKTRASLESFRIAPPERYVLAAREAVNNRRQREIRNEFVQGLLITQ